MTVTQGQITNLLLRETLFRDLNETEIAELAQKFQPVSLAPNGLLYQQGDAPDAFYFVYTGRLRATQVTNGSEREMHIYRPGDYFGEEGLLFKRPRAAAVTALEPSVVLRLPEVEFQALHQRYPSFAQQVSAAATSRALARRREFAWLAPEEIVYLVTRRHDFFLFLAVLPPLLLGLGALPLAAFAYLSNSVLWLVVGAIAFLVALGWGGWNWLDWSNDYYLVTNQRVLWIEKVVGLYDSRREAPLDSILATDVVSSLAGRILNYGTVTVRTYTGTILLRNTSQPYLLAQIIDGYKNRAVELGRQTAQQELQKDVRTALKKRLDPNTVVVPSYRQKTVVQAPPRKPGWGESLNNLLRLRYEEKGVITYRKHWFLLITQAWAPLLALLAWLGGVIALAWSDMFSTPVLALIVLAFFGILGWLVYEYLDWSNDIYRLTATQIQDIDRTPLGREEKKTANLDSPDFRVEHERANIIGILLNFGDVIVNVGQTEFTFQGVFNPDQVHQDVVHYRQALTQRKKSAEVNLERQRMLDYLTAYHDTVQGENNNPPP